MPHGMTSKQWWKLRKRCEVKLALGKDRARKAAADMQRKNGVLYDAYRCPVCRKWHVGRRDKWNLLAGKESS